MFLTQRIRACHSERSEESVFFLRIATGLRPRNDKMQGTVLTVPQNKATNLQ